MSVVGTMQVYSPSKGWQNVNLYNSYSEASQSGAAWTIQHITLGTVYVALGSASNAYATDLKVCF